MTANEFVIAQMGQPRMPVTDEMVQRACVAWFSNVERHNSTAHEESAMRKALEAALNGSEPTA